MKLKTVMEDRGDLINSELMGMAFDSCQAAFKSSFLDIMFNQTPPDPVMSEPIHIFVDPAAGGPGSDYAFVSITRFKGMITVSFFYIVFFSYVGRLCVCEHYKIQGHDYGEFFFSYVSILHV